MENTKQTPQEKSTLSNILEQIKIVLVIYGIGKVDSGKLCNGSDCDYLEKCCEKT